MWGFFFLQPRLFGVSGFLAHHFGFIPIFHSNDDLFGSSAFIAGIVVSLMVIPITTAISREVFSQAPSGEKEAALALGGTRWGMVRAVTLPFGKGGVIGGSMLGLGRALGETIAVAIIISPTFEIHPSILDRGANSVAARIALEFGDAASSPLHLSALLAAGLVLFLLTLVVNSIAAFIVARSRSGSGVDI
jgi:phosphate transport system permease protein